MQTPFFSLSYQQNTNEWNVTKMLYKHRLSQAKNKKGHNKTLGEVSGSINVIGIYYAGVYGDKTQESSIHWAITRFL